MSGRPPVVPGERQTVQITVRLSPILADLVYLAALREGVSGSTMIRHVLTGYFVVSK